MRAVCEQNVPTSLDKQKMDDAKNIPRQLSVLLDIIVHKYLWLTIADYTSLICPFTTPGLKKKVYLLMMHELLNTLF